ncbi:alpha/beta hydrolase family protein [Paenalcaligenes sp. Me131]|uniref:alpha/beta hydrolase family protein n=1 Tax=Paenalcaligenes sp. Me131 TaxID=3392636 RepID=UPI003D2BF5B2
MEKLVLGSARRRRLRTVVAGSAMALLSTITVAQSAMLLPRSDGSDIVYYVQPAALQPAQQLLVVMQGSDCNSVIHNPRIQEMFVPMLPGADVLTVEKYGIDASLPWDQNTERTDCPADTIQYDSLMQRVSDYQAVLNMLKWHQNYKNVVVVGGSEGAVTAVLLAAETDLVDASIAFNGGGRWFKEDVIHSIRVAPLAESEKAEALAGIQGFIEYVSGTPDPELVASNHGVAWWQSMLRHDQQAALASVKTPLLLLQSGLDTSVDPVAVEQMVRQVQQAGPTQVRYRYYPELDHVMQDAQGQSQLKDVMADMQDWLAEVLLPQP